MKNHLKHTFPLLAWLFSALLMPFDGFSQSLEEKPISSIPKSIELKLKRDAARLALRSIAEGSRPESQHILIPDYKIEEIFGVLATLYRQNATVRAIENCDVHTFPNPSIDRMMVIFKKNARWAESVRKSGQMSGSDPVSQLLMKYELNVEKFVRWDDAHDALVLRAEAPLNMAALGLVFSKIEDVVKVETGVPETTGNDILVKPVSEGWEVVYILRFGAHISGEGKLHTWKFRVTNGNRIKFLGESGSKIPAWMDCTKASKKQ